MALSDIIQDANVGIFSSRTTEIVAISGVVDLYESESHSFTVTKTKYKVEDGSTRTDNAATDPEKLVLKGVVSDLLSFAGGIVSISNPSRGKEAWERILALKNSFELLTIITSLRVYENMLIVGGDTTVNRDTGKALVFSLSLEEQEFAETQTVLLAPSKLDGPASTKGSDAEGGLKQSEEIIGESKTAMQIIVSGISGVF